MKNLTLTRLAYLPFGTFGKLASDDGLFKCSTVEREWNGNQPFISCIPEGVYHCEKRNSPKWGETFEVMDVLERDHILFHRGNWPDKFQGCIGMGKEITNVLGELGVNYSEKTIVQFKKYMTQAAFDLTIVQYDPMDIYNNGGRQNS